MQIVLNENNEVVAYALVGELDKAVEVSDEFATADFISNPFRYKLSDGALVVNPDYQNPVIDDSNTPGPLEQAQEQIVALVQQHIMDTRIIKQMQDQIIQLTKAVMTLQKGEE
ncbi:DUF2977 domain-containing protein [Bacillus atrophaeus]|uniref:DUF2977 domain-containing protein n=1 Tax=Bacillus atrophaeus TaxID=1452 RepID=UPI002281F39D|nr:DUF2977 domain-containing protein [Bacillus atrophaeus]MCY8842475.1 DUF2977 domain-containing protein [Bacillus atrophaeus]MEC0804685.1 DUF2977 domain-containing protein [Bacillus atrophaeus]MEC0852602.1 DUF2977 domain-containing protein [Bacillus atrophaeus]MEC0859514.1 DUF2977 domain-containing protein [Bacillus atrophaeus]MEC0862321.1 DUF2977 domain-containing protein [Bacillus atrophaeus]